MADKGTYKPEAEHQPSEAETVSTWGTLAGALDTVKEASHFLAKRQLWDLASRKVDGICSLRLFCSLPVCPKDPWDCFQFPLAKLSRCCLGDRGPLLLSSYQVTQPHVQNHQSFVGTRCLECVHATERKKKELARGEEQRLPQAWSSYKSQVRPCSRHPGKQP